MRAMHTLTRRQLLQGLGLSMLACMLHPARSLALAANIPRPLIIGLRGNEITADHREMIEKIAPIGIILYRQNIVDKNQLRDLTAAIREAAGKDTLIMLDGEGGKILRLKPPTWRRYPGASDLASIAAQNEDDAKRATYLSYRLIAADMAECGINTNIAPVCDLRHHETMAESDYRSFGSDSKKVASLALTACKATLEAGVLPVIKHMPGQGRVQVNTDLHLVPIDASMEELEKDFSVFRELRDMPLAMASNVVFSAVDSKNAAYQSPAMMQLIRNNIGFNGLMLTDDLASPAMLVKDRETTIKTAFAAGNDIIQYNFGILDPNDGAPYLPPANPKTFERVQAALRLAKESYKPADTQALREEFDSLLARYNIKVG